MIDYNKLTARQMKELINNANESIKTSALHKISELHTKSRASDRCGHCQEPYPCPTVMIMIEHFRR